MGKRNLPFPGQPSSPEDPFTSESEPSQGKHPPVQVWNRKAQRFTSDMPARHDNTVWDQPFIDNGEASPTFKALLRIMFSWADEHLKPKDTTFMELPKLAELGQLGRLPDDCNIGECTYCNTITSTLS